MTTVIDYNEIKEEIVVKLRNANILSTTQRNVTTVVETFDGNDLTIDFVLSNSNLKNIRTITISSVAQDFGSDYTVNYKTATVTFLSAPATGSDNISITYDYGTDRIFTDLPKNTLTVNNFPRIGVDIIGDNSDENELSGDTKITNISFSIVVYSVDTDDIDTCLKAIRTLMLTEQKNFYNLRYVQRLLTGPLLLFAESNNQKIMQRNVDYLSRFNIEIA
jgi:hypothetical protein